MNDDPAATEMVGRDGEVAVLCDLLARAEAGQGGAAALVGEAGIGKTTLARAMVGHARHRGVHVAVGHCFERDETPAFGLFADALSSLANELGVDELARLLGPHAPSLVALVPRLRGALPDPEAAQPLPAREQRVRLVEAVTQLVLAGGPTLLVLEDLHWADAGSLDLIEALAPHLGASRWLLLLTCREEGEGELLLRTLAALRREARYRRLPLQGLEADASHALLTTLAGGPVAPDLVASLRAQTGGNPFYLRELYRHLVEERRIPARGAFDAAAAGVPHGVREVVARRLSRLSEAARQALSVAAAFANGLRMDVVAEVTGLGEEALLSAIDEAVAAGLLRIGSSGGHEFSHAVVQRAVEAAENADRRARVHRRIALALERVPHGEAVAELAAQYHASLRLPGAERGVRHAVAAAELARAAAAHEGAVRLLRIGVQLADTAPVAERAAVLAKLAQAEAEALLFDDARHSAERALDAMEAAGADRSAKVQTLEQVARELRAGGAPPECWRPLWRRGLDIAGDRRDLPWARLRLLEDRCEPLRGGPPFAGRWIGFDAEAMAIARAGDDEDSWAATLTPYDFRSRDETRQVLARARSWRRPSAILRGLDAAARDLLHRQCDYREARAVLDEMLWVAERFGSIAGQAEALYGLAKCQAILGDIALARATAARVPPLVARLGGVHRLQLMARTALHAEIDYLGGGDWAQAATDAGAFVRRPEARESALGLLSIAFAALGHALCAEPQAARQMAMALATLVEQGQRRDYMNQSAIDIAATAVWHAGAVDLAPRFLALEQAADPEAGTAPIGCVELQRARLSGLVGDLARARSAFEEARAVLDARGFIGASAIADVDEARLLAPTDAPAATELARRALDRFTALGMTPWQARAEALLADAGAGLPGGLPHGVTAREAEVLRLVAAGHSSKQIARTLFVSLATVNRHIANVYPKIGAGNRADATRFAIAHGLIDRPAQFVSDHPLEK